MVLFLHGKPITVYCLLFSETSENYSYKYKPFFDYRRPISSLNFHSVLKDFKMIAIFHYFIIKCNWYFEIR